ncbi:hypothetical protein HDK90DRAFT_14366 [Phyllosticta capitalensis]|uniref:Secreted protein n=1 Tax=Phyllosticta capitalensis TaxID=121624 RepID=A0ABR1Z2F9_9PEZI
MSKLGICLLPAASSAATLPPPLTSHEKKKKKEDPKLQTSKDERKRESREKNTTINLARPCVSELVQRIIHHRCCPPNHHPTVRQSLSACLLHLHIPMIPSRYLVSRPLFAARCSLLV